MIVMRLRRDETITRVSGQKGPYMGSSVVLTTSKGRFHEVRGPHSSQNEFSEKFSWNFDEKYLDSNAPAFSFPAKEGEEIIGLQTRTSGNNVDIRKDLPTLGNTGRSRKLTCWSPLRVASKPVRLSKINYSWS